ncbi:SAM-dependent methyltransferase [Spongiactinospora sp. TRM90649]|uniref:SAM-dependent methyltransferase n=1 Tax=Spongiactinospora sp. TRM90649 TaxID=3031114 RepID=UPI0023F643A3|nr:SAM-dependent methyltransferase [Spongiactinospora sp. TRM90649]MDF5755613.1 SAM-dependent methyltransferase [Spongiactinospora sp. TRM90649]
MDPKALGAGFNPHIPNSARMYDYFLGGKNNLPVDRDAAEKVLKYVPEIPIGIRENREFLCRAVRFLAERGVRQFLDIGAGLPTQHNVHQVAAEVAPDSRTVYVDNDPQVLVHARALLQDSPNVIIAEGDLRYPGEILGDPGVRAHLDFERPVAVLMLAILHFIPDADEPLRIIGELRDALPPGSYLALSHVTVDERPEAAPAVERIYQNASTPFVGRMSSEVEPMFDGLDLVAPGVVNLHEWRSEAQVLDPLLEKAKPYFLCGIGEVV